ncbi:hypothetical protein GQ457_06G016340 [Hibiscus cannabinus]
MVRDMVDAGGNWDWFRLEQLLLEESLERIVSIQPPGDSLGEDRPQWRWEPNCQFSSQSTYAFLSNSMIGGQRGNWKRIWKLHVPQRVCVFAWLSFHERLLTNVERVRRHSTDVDLCDICMSGREDINHVLRTFVAAEGVWHRLIPHEISESFEEQVFTIRALQPTIRWKMPPSQWIKVNVDAAVSTVDSSAGLGTSFRDDIGEWLFGSTRFIGRCSVLIAELWAIHEGLMHAWSRGYRQVELESDSLEAVRLVLSSSPEVAVCGLVLSIKGWLSKVWQVRIQHVSREGNRVADRMATKGRMQRGLNATFIEVPTDVRDLVAGERSQSGLDRVDSMEEGVIPYDPGGGTSFC